jgi:hypothetical protein
MTTTKQQQQQQGRVIVGGGEERGLRLLQQHQDSIQLITVHFDSRYIASTDVCRQMTWGLN